MDYAALKNEDLCILIQKGDKTAEEVLLRNNVRFLQSIINSVRCEFHSGTDLVSNEDLLQEGYIALMCSARSFDISRGIQFSTYTYKRVHGSILDQVKRSVLAEIHKKEDYDVLKEACEQTSFRVLRLFHSIEDFLTTKKGSKLSNLSSFPNQT